MTTSAPLSAFTQFPRFTPSHTCACQGAAMVRRAITVTSFPSSEKCLASSVPTCPDPPIRTARQVRLNPSPGIADMNDVTVLSVCTEYTEDKGYLQGLFFESFFWNLLD